MREVSEVVGDGADGAGELGADALESSGRPIDTAEAEIARGRGSGTSSLNRFGSLRSFLRALRSARDMSSSNTISVVGFYKQTNKIQYKSVPNMTDSNIPPSRQMLDCLLQGKEGRSSPDVPGLSK